MSERVQKAADHGGGAGHGPASPFSEAEWKAFRKDDVTAGGAVVVLMTAIFTIGLILYTVVAIAVAS